MNEPIREIIATIIDMIVVLSDNLENHNIIERKIQVFERTNHIREEMSKDEEKNFKSN